MDKLPPPRRCWIPTGTRRQCATVREAGLETSAEPLLAIEDVALRFGGVVALDGVSFAVRAGEICGLIGPNGSGKTSLFNCISGIYRCDRGEIRFAGRALTGLPRRARAPLGIGRTFQNLALFRQMTVRENVLVGGHARLAGGFLGHALRLPAVRREERTAAVQADALLELLDLGPVAGAPVDSLPFGTQKRVELARALAGEPRFLLLDEPAGGLNHAEVDALSGLLRAIRDRFRLTLLLVEHHMNLVMRLSDRVVALDFGRKIADGTPAEVQAHPDVARAYLGPGHAAGPLLAPHAGAA